MIYLIIIAVAVISYLIGSVNFSILISRAISGKDIRESGSGNAGATNMLRTHGKKMGIITLLLDVLKGVAAVFLIRLIRDKLGIGGPAIDYIAGVCVILGHNFPLYFGFRGGKGVATSLGVVLMLNWKAGLIVAVIAVAVMAATRYVSLGSVIGGAMFIIAGIWSILYQSSLSFSNASFGARMYAAVKLLFSGGADAVRVICVVVIGGLLIARHHENIKRLLNGTENKLGQKKDK